MAICIWGLGFGDEHCPFRMIPYLFCLCVCSGLRRNLFVLHPM